MALNLMDGNGQPALLYIVPCTLGMGSCCDCSFVIVPTAECIVGCVCGGSTSSERTGSSK